MPINNSTSEGFFRWRPAAWLRVTGPDAAVFLQGQFTQELRDLPAGDARYGLWLSVKGKVLADSFVVRRDAADEYYIGSYFSPASVIKERLESFIIADDVTVEDLTADWRAVSVFGAAGGEVTAPADGFVFAGRRDSVPVQEWVFPATTTDPVAALVGSGAEISEAEIVRRRIRAGIPAVPADAGPGDLPNEAGLEAVAISYTKGCYLGQEVMARLKSMGQVRRRLVRVRSVVPVTGNGAEGAIDGVPALPCPVFAGGRQVGELRSAVREITGELLGLALVSRLHVSADSLLSLTSDAPGTLRLLDVP